VAALQIFICVNHYVFKPKPLEDHSASIRGGAVKVGVEQVEVKVKTHNSKKALIMEKNAG
jgi:hypothetical protein